MRMAIPVWRSRVSPVFDAAEELLVSDFENGREFYRTRCSMSGLSAEQRANQLAELDVDVLLCGAISRPLENLIGASGVRVIPWVRGEIDGVLEWYLNGMPANNQLLMPGCARRRQKRERRRMRGQPEITWGKSNEDCNNSSGRSDAKPR